MSCWLYLAAVRGDAAAVENGRRNLFLGASSPCGGPMPPTLLARGDCCVRGCLLRRDTGDRGSPRHRYPAERTRGTLR